MTTKQKRRKWHDDNRDFVFDYFGGTCQVCKSKINIHITKWDVHHFHYNYKNRLYDTNAEELIENNVITLICRPCHDIEHTAKDSENPQHLENKFPCEICGRLERGIFDRKRGEMLDKLLCRKCFLNSKKIDVGQLTLF